jgi:hypothetical protein
MIHKRLLCPERVRRTLPNQFSWLDHRLVRDGYIDLCHPEALALYLFLVTVSDSWGLSYYADTTITRRFSLPQVALEHARHSLITAQLIVYQVPLYQVLALQPDTPAAPQSVSRTEANRPVVLAALLKQMKNSS